MDTALAYVRGLEERDVALEQSAALLEDARLQAEGIAARAAEISDFLDRLPGERERMEASVADAGSARAAALAALEQARSQGESDDQRRAVEQAEAGLRRAEDRLSRAEREREELERTAALAGDEVVALEQSAREVASRLGALPALAGRDVAEPAVGLAGLLSWAPRARAAAFMAKGRLDREREALARQAEETAASVLAEPLAGASVHVVRRRLERETA